MNKRIFISLAAFVIWVLITVVVSNWIAGGQHALSDSVNKGIGWTFVGAAAFLLAVTAWQGWNDVGLNKLAHPGTLKLLWLPAFFIVGLFGTGWVMGLPPASAIVFTLINTFFVGLSEELMFRGILFQAFRTAMKIWPAIIVTTVAFGAIHVLNVFVTGNFIPSVAQALGAGMSGLLFMALRLRTGSLWPVVITHGLWDFATFTASTANGSTSSPSDPAPSVLLTFVLPLLFTLPNALYGLWLLRNVRRDATEA